MLKDRSADGEPGSATEQSRDTAEVVPQSLTSDVEKLLDTHGISREKLAEVMSGLSICATGHGQGGLHPFCQHIQGLS